jgi:hypothetical protein
MVVSRWRERLNGNIWGCVRYDLRRNSNLYDILFFREAHCTKRGPRPPLLGKKGAPANFLRGSRQIIDTENTDRVFLRYRYGKYREIPTDTDRKIPTQYTTLHYSIFLNFKRDFPNFFIPFGRIQSCLETMIDSSSTLQALLSSANPWGNGSLYPIGPIHSVETQDCQLWLWHDDVVMP